MTLLKRGRIWHYDFWYAGARHQGTTGQDLRDDAEQVERDVKRRLRQEAFGIRPITRDDTPTFTAFAEHYLKAKRATLGRPDLVERTLRMVLAFWGRRPTKSTPVEGGVYHDLRLADPILEPAWIDRFDAWMDARGLSASTKNTYRSTLSGLYKLALRPRFRKATRVERNPFLDIDRDRPARRHVHLPMDNLRAWVQQAPPHAVIALVVGALAPKLRLQQVLQLRFDRHLDPDLTVITFDAHKTRRHTGRPQVTPVSDSLREVLLALRQARPGQPHVITFRGEPVASIRTAIRRAAKAAGLPYGVKAGGVTFHALRHAMASEAARMGIAGTLHAAVLGHKDPRTTEQFYTHMVSEDERGVLEQLAGRAALTESALAAVGTFVGTRIGTDRRTRAKLRMLKGARSA